MSTVVTGASREGDALRLYNSDGNENWTVPIERNFDTYIGIAADFSGVYLARGGVLTGYGLDGRQMWQAKYADGRARVVLHSSGIYVRTGTRTGNGRSISPISTAVLSLAKTPDTAMANNAAAPAPDPPALVMCT